MAKAWQYSRGRRLALQGVMCLVLGASVGVAAYVQHLRRPPQVELGPVEEHGRLRYALPVGWKGVRELTIPVTVTVVAREPRKRGRSIRVAIMPTTRRLDADSLLSLALQSQLPPDQLEPISFLGEEGVLLEANTDDPSLSGLYAAVVTDDGTGVILSIRGEGAFGPSSRKLLKQVASTMTLAPPETETETP
jgi:hypothetical protein